MRSFLLGAPVEGSFNIPFKVERSQIMKTVTCDVQCRTSGDVYNWCVSLGFTTQNFVLIRKSPLNTSVEGRFTPYCILCPVSAATNCFRFNGPDALVLGTVGSGRTETMIIDAGAEYYVFEAAY